MNAALYLNHPYGVPVIGWMHEIAKLSREDALTFYKHYYAPNNAILVVSGDVTAEEVKALAEATYGKIPANPDVERRASARASRRSSLPRRLELKDPRAGNFSFHRYYHAPSYVTAKPGEAEALEMMMKIAATGSTSRLYKKLVVETKAASSAGGDYAGYGSRWRHVSVYAVANDGVPLAKVEALIDDVFADVVKNGVTAAELERAKKPSSPTTSTRATTRRRWPAATAGLSRSAARSTDVESLAGADFQGDGRGRQEGGRGISRHPPVGDRLHDAGQGGGRRAQGAAAAPASNSDGEVTPMISQLFARTAFVPLPRWRRAVFALGSPCSFSQLATPTPASAMNIQTVKSPGGIEAWLVEEHSRAD